MVKVAFINGKNVLVEYAPLSQIYRLDVRAIEGRFNVLILLNENDWDERDLSKATEHLLMHGCRYFMTHGKRAKTANDIADEVRDKFDLPERPVVMTSWLNESFNDAVEYALVFAFPDFDIQITDVLIVRCHPTLEDDERLNAALAQLR